MSLTYYLTIDGIDGGSTAVGHVGAFEISAYDFHVTGLPPASGGAGGGAGTVEFSPLTVDLALGLGLTALLSEVASGSHIPAVRLEGVTAGNQTVYDIKLADATIGLYQDTNGGPDRLVFDYARVGVSTVSQNADGSFNSAQSFAWNVAGNVAIDPATLPTPVPGSSAGIVPQPVTYYLTIDGIDGGSSAVGHVGAFEISAYDFHVTGLPPASGGAGGGAGTVEFSPLTVDLALGSGLTALLSEVASGSHIPAVRLEGVTAGNQTVYDIKLADATIGLYQDTNGGPDRLVFDYARVGVSTVSQNADGSFNSAQSFAWNVAGNIAIDPATLPTPVPGSSAGIVPQPVTYYLTIDGIDGGSSAVGHVGAFEISAYDFHVTGLPPASGGAGGGAGTVEFSPLTVDLALGLGLTALLSEVASGSHIPAVRLEGVTAGNQTVYDIKLADATIGLYQDTNGGPDRLVFDYARVGVSTVSQNADGSFNSAQSFAWNVAGNIAIDPATLPTPVPGSSAGIVPQPVTYYLTIDGIDGGSSAVGHVGAFEISAYDFHVTGLPPASGGAGGGAGTVEFSPLTVDLALGLGLTALLSEVASGSHIPAVRLEGVTAGNQTVYDIKLADATIGLYQDTNGGPDRLVFDYARVGVSTVSQNADGSFNSAQSFAWNVAGNVAIDPATLPTPVPGSSAGIVPQPVTYYLTIDGIDGGSSAVGHVGAFEISAYDFHVTGLPPASGGAGGGAGTVEFSPLTVDLALGLGLTALLSEVASGSHIPAVRLEGVTAGNQTVYDIKLADATIGLYQDTNGGPDRLVFDYARVGVSTVSQNADGSFNSAQSFAWNVAGNVAIDPATLPTPVPGSSAGIVPQPVTYYLTIDGIDGGSSAVGHVGAFEISAYDFHVTGLPPASGGAGGGAGTVEFSPLTVDLALGSGLTALLSEVASGSHIRAVRLEGVTAGNQTVYDIKLADATIGLYQDTNGGPDRLVFDYARVGLSTVSQNADGSFNSAQSFAWNVAGNVAIDPATLPTPVPHAPSTAGDDIIVGTFGADLIEGGGGNDQINGGAGDDIIVGDFEDPNSPGSSAGIVPQPVTYYLTIDGIDGGSSAVGHVGAFEISAYDFHVTGLPPASGGAGGGAGTVEFSPLTVDLALGLGLTALLSEVASGSHIPAVRLEGVTAGNQTVYDIKLADATIGLYQDTNGGPDRLVFDYARVGVSTVSQNADGSFNSAQSFAWNVAGNVAIDPATLPTPVPGSSAGIVPQPVTYYLTIDGIDGGSSAVGHVGAFEISAYDFHVTGLPPASGGAGGGAGTVEFSPLTVDLALGLGLTALLSEVASGSHIPAVRLEGVTAGNQTVYDIKLADATIGLYQDTNGGPDRLVFDYARVGVSTVSQNADGSFNSAQSFAWNVAGNVAIDPATLPTPVPGSSAGIVPQPVTYYLTIDGIDGGSSAVGHVGAFEISAYDFHVTGLPPASGGAGGGAGTVEFSPLTVDLALGLGLTALLSEVASGSHIPAVRLEGVTAGNQTVYDIKLADATIGLYQDTNGGPDRLVFDYARVGVSTVSQNADGSFNSAQSFAWNVAGNVAIDPATLPTPVPGSSAGIVPQPVTYYLTIDGIDGGSSAVGHVGAFEISAYDFHVTGLPPASGGAGGGAGTVEFSPLTVDLALGLGLTALLSEVASGSHIPAVRLEGVTAGNQTVYDIKLADATIGLYQDTNGGPDRLVFDYARVGVSTVSQNADGSFNSAQSFAWNVAGNVAIDPATLPTPVPGSSAGIVPQPVTYYLTIDGIDGGSSAVGHVGAFEISAYDFHVTGLPPASGGAGGGAGTVEFSPLTVDLALGLGLTALLSEVASGSHIPAVRLEGVTAGNQTVYDIKLADATIGLYQDTNGGPDRLVFDYARVGVSTVSQNADGSFNSAQSFAWNVAGNVAIDPATLPTPVPGSSAGIVPQPVTYYLTIDGIDGGSSAVGHVGAFEISAYDFHVTGLPPASGGAGGGAGTVEFSPLTVDLALGLGLTALLSEVASGSHIPAVRLEGVTAGNQTVYDIKLADATIGLYQDTNGGPDRLVFDYARVGVSTVSQNADGSFNSAQSFAWNVAGNVAINPATLPTPATGVSGDDTLTGGLGADTFVYRTGDGTDTITDFNIAEGDRVDLTGVAGVHSLSDLSITQVGADTIITLGSGLVLENFLSETLTPAQFLFSQAPTALQLSNAAVAENSAAGKVVGDLSASDPDAGETFTFSLIDDAGGLFVIDGTKLKLAGALDYEMATSHNVTARVTDSVGNVLDKTFTVSVTNVNETPTGVEDSANVVEDASVLIDVLFNDSDVDLGDTLTITSLSGSKSTLGASISIESGQIRYTADADVFDLAAFAGTIDEFTYTAMDPGGLPTGPITVQVTVSPANDNRTLFGTVKPDSFTDASGFDTTYFANIANDIVFGRDGSDTLHGENGNDQLFGGAGIDFLFGENGNDRLEGGDGNDVLAGGQGNDYLLGGNGSDLFQFEKNAGNDTIGDFVVGVDHLQLNGLTVARLTTADVDHTGALDAVVSFKEGGSVALLGVNGISDWHLLT